MPSEAGENADHTQTTSSDKYFSKNAMVMKQHSRVRRWTRGNLAASSSLGPAARLRRWERRHEESFATFTPQITSEPILMFWLMSDMRCEHVSSQKQKGLSLLLIRHNYFEFTQKGSGLTRVWIQHVLIVRQTTVLWRSAQMTIITGLNPFVCHKTVFGGKIWTYE